MNKKTQLPSFTRRSSIAIDNDYLDWLSEVKDRLCHIQAKTAFQVNRAMLEFYWSMGRDLALRKELGKHGDGIVTKCQSRPSCGISNNERIVRKQYLVNETMVSFLQQRISTPTW